MKSLFLTIAAASLCSATLAQHTYIYNSPQAEFQNAMTLYDAAMYGASRSAFALFQQNWADHQDCSVLVEDARYFEALSAKLSKNPDALRQLDDFQHFDHHNAHCADAYFHAGEYALAKNDVKEAVAWFEKADENDVSSQNRVPLLFKKGYCYFMQDRHNLAIAQFDKFEGEEGEFASAVKYYRAHVYYENGNVDTALKLFLELEQDDGFHTAASYYIAQILYIKGHYAEAIRYATPLAAQSNEKAAEMTRIVADSHFMLAEYDDAITTYNKLSKLLSGKLTRPDYYHIGLALFRTGKYADAAANLSKVTSGDDAISQNAYYNLAACCIKLGDKKRARTAFDAASRYNYDAAIAEDAHFNKLKLAYELNFAPFNDLVSDFIDYLKLYPNSPHRDEAYSLVGKALISTKNYEKALDALEKIEHKDLALYKALQRISFYHALELFSDDKTEEAARYLDYSLKYGDYDSKIKARSIFWSAECLLADKKPSEARDKYLAFLNAYQSVETPEFNVAHYDIAYTYYNSKDYAQARRWFVKFVSIDNDKADAELVADAYNRIGDCLYVDRDFRGAIGYYDKSLATSSAKADYSYLQKGICLGLMGDMNGKLAQLDNVIAKFPKSRYVDNAYFEKGRAYVALGEIKDAIYNYKVVKEKFPKGSLAPQAMLQLGLLYYNNNDLDNSMAFYKRVINEYPSTPMAADALTGLRNVYMERSDYDGYIAYTSTLGSFAHVGERERDSLMFVSAVNLYLKSDFERAMASFNRYLESFPTGLSVTPANYYLADCYYSGKEFDQALPLYMEVASQPRSVFTEEALLRSGELLYKSDRFEEALVQFQRLEVEAEVESNVAEAIIGQMRCMSKKGDLALCVSSADKVINLPYAAPAILREAQYLKAKSLIAMNRASDALPDLRSLAESTKTTEGAEAKFLVARILFDSGNTDAAETEILDYVDKGTPHQYWLAKSFILLADVYHTKGDDFQAVQYLLTLKDSYVADDDIASEINARLSVWDTADALPATDVATEAQPVM